MPSRDSLGDRMKRYENCYRLSLPRRMPVIIRIDGRAFHTFTRGFKRPFDNVMRQTMQQVALDLANEVAGCKLAYVQSDEISLLLTNDDTLDTEPWFGNVLQKLVSITSSIATRSFNYWYRAKVNANTIWYEDEKCFKMPGGIPLTVYGKGFDAATFDSRAFVIPEAEVVNYFLWRQQDATRNSIEMCAQSMFSHKELHGKNCKVLQDMMFTKKGFNWNDLDVDLKRGACARKNEGGEWEIDRNIPIFSQDRAYIENLLPSVIERKGDNASESEY